MCWDHCVQMGYYVEKGVEWSAAQRAIWIAVTGGGGSGHETPGSDITSLTTDPNRTCNPRNQAPTF